MFFSAENIFSWLLAYRYIMLFPIMVIEGPIITIIAGFFSSTGIFNFALAYAIIVAGDLAGDTIYYALGRWGRAGFIDRWGHRFGLSYDRIMKLEKHFGNHTGKTLIAGKITHAIGSFILVAAGVARVSYWKFLWFNFLSTVPKSLAFMLLGYYFGSAFMRLNSYVTLGSLVLVAFFAIILLTVFLMKKLGKRIDNQLIQ